MGDKQGCEEKYHESALGLVAVCGVRWMMKAISSFQVGAELSSSRSRKPNYHQVHYS